MYEYHQKSWLTLDIKVYMLDVCGPEVLRKIVFLLLDCFLEFSLFWKPDLSCIVLKDYCTRPDSLVLTCLCLWAYLRLVLLYCLVLSDLSYESAPLGLVCLVQSDPPAWWSPACPDQLQSETCLALFSGSLPWLVYLYYYIIENSLVLLATCDWD